METGPTTAEIKTWEFHAQSSLNWKIEKTNNNTQFQLLYKKPQHDLCLISQSHLTLSLHTSQMENTLHCPLQRIESFNVLIIPITKYQPNSQKQHSKHTDRNKSSNNSNNNNNPEIKTTKPK
eukprot:TRINITY_DN10105_c0_g1_i1.p1 TRINITY_DN10105_c0_g1~~TRINITY_DN10105_c0_g1_i1.p1  ORF type:complete len:122 (-),score=8.68 TRINITY_DN10105_c0_g1_i1:102-467(-)